MGEPGLLKLDFSHYIKSAPATVIRCCKIKTLCNALRLMPTSPPGLKCRIMMNSVED